MTLPRLNTLTQSLKTVLADAPIQEKWVLAPSLRIGYQWLDVIARSGQPVLNARVKTLRHLALDLAQPHMLDYGLALLHGPAQEVLMSRAFARLPKRRQSYLARLIPTPGLMRGLVRTLCDLRLAGFTSRTLRTEACEVKEKGRELARLLEAFVAALDEVRLVDYAAVLSLAKEHVRSDAQALPVNALLLYPEDLQLNKLEQELLQSFPEGARRGLLVDKPNSVGDGTDRALLSFILDPSAAPPPKNDATAQITHAQGEVNEVRAILRACAEEGVPWDEVEILHTDTETYVPLIFEQACNLTEHWDALPVTFEEGIPCRYTRPGRALAAWVAWQQRDFPQSVLQTMLLDGLFAGTDADMLPQLVSALRTVPIGAGRDRYGPCLSEAVNACIRRQEDLQEEEEIEPSRSRAREISTLEIRKERLQTVWNLVERLLADLPSSTDDPQTVLKRAQQFVETSAASRGQMDKYARKGLLAEIRALGESLAPKETMALDVWAWLKELPNVKRVGGQGPRPGHLYVAPLLQGGHTGRAHTYVLGLDHMRFPGAGLQDPVLLDAERARLERGALPTAAGRLDERRLGLAKLLARLRGHVHLSYPCANLQDDREVFPNPLLVNAWRLLAAKPMGTQEEFTQAYPLPAAFAPCSAQACVLPSDWWLWRLAEETGITDALSTVAAHFPHLGRGMRAAAARASSQFTAYDGCVPEAGQACAGAVLSASSLELFGRSPWEYFLRKVLDVEVPEEYERDPNQWLDALQRGTLLHEVFRQTLLRLLEEDRWPPAADRDQDLVDRVLDQKASRLRAKLPPPSTAVYEQEIRALRQACRIFLREEELHAAGQPFCLEASIGMHSVEPGTPLDTRGPITMALPQGQTLRVRGRVDRVDREDRNTYRIWDYKTGSNRYYSVADPFDQGRRVQNALYVALVQERLRALGEDEAQVDSFGYIFPTQRAYGDRVVWPRAVLQQGLATVTQLLLLMGQGCFPLSECDKDYAFSEDYVPAFGDKEAAMAQAKAKILNLENTMLAPWRELRGYA